MSKFKRRLQKIEEFDKCLDIIEDNLSCSTKNILGTFREKGYSEKILNNMMGNFYISDKEHEKTIRSYIKRRKNKENLLKRSNFLGKEEKYDTYHVFRTTILLDIINKYRFCHLYVYKDEISMSKINLNKLFKETFRMDTFIYPEIKGGHIYEPEEIIYFNENFMGKKFEDDDIYKQIKFEHFYNRNNITINNITYYSNDRSWMDTNMKKIFRDCQYMKYKNSFFNYSTILCNTKEFLKVIMDINNETTNYKYDKTNIYRHDLKITCEEDIHSHYEKSVEEIKSTLTEEEWRVFKEILKVENENDFYNEYSIDSIDDLPYDFDNIRSKTFYKQDKSILFALLIKGYVYIK